MGELKTFVEVHELCASDQNSVRMRRLPREEKATSEVDVDVAPRLSISNDIWILILSLFVSSTNHFQIVRRLP